MQEKLSQFYVFAIDKWLADQNSGAEQRPLAENGLAVRIPGYTDSGRIIWPGATVTPDGEYLRVVCDNGRMFTSQDTEETYNLMVELLGDWGDGSDFLTAEEWRSSQTA